MAAHWELTEREREVLQLAQFGLTNEEIAEVLGISRNGVRYHLKELHSKLETKGSRPHLLTRVVRAILPGGLFRPAVVQPVLASVAVASFSVAGFVGVRAAHQHFDADPAGLEYCVAEVRPTPGPGESALESASNGQRCFDTVDEKEAYYESLRD